MNTIFLKYLSSEGEVSERCISDWIAEGEDAINAYCSLRKDRRTFNLMKILYAADIETGEIITNIWHAFGLDLTNDGSERLISVLAHQLNSIKVLKFYAMSTRGFSKRERDHIINFILQGCSIHPYSLKDINTWLYALWSGNVYAYRSGMTEEYETLLSAIPSSQLNAVRKTATLIAGGSGRQVLTNEAISRLEQDFC